MTKDGEKLAVLECWRQSLSGAGGTRCPWRIGFSSDDSAFLGRRGDNEAWPEKKKIDNINKSDEINCHSLVRHLNEDESFSI